MASVMLVKNGRTLNVQTPRDFVAAVYGRGYLPAVGSVAASYQSLLDGSSPTPLPTGTYATVTQLADHINSVAPHRAYDVDMPSLRVLFENGIA